MTNLTPAEKLRAALQAENDKKTRTPNQNIGGDNASYQFWNIPEGQTATVRFLPDGNSDSPFFWTKREVIKLVFEGQVGGDYPTDKPVTVTVPCVDMFGDICPIIAETKPWWKQGKEKEDLARRYYKKKSYIFQGFVVNSPFEEPTVPENPIRRFVINPSIFEIIEKSLMNPEMEDLPTDYVGGRDFKLAKTKKGDYANYSTSSWSLRTRPLNEIENIAIQHYGLSNLADFRGSRPDADGIAMIKAMFHDSLNGDPFDFYAYGKFYRAYGDRQNGTDSDSDNGSHAGSTHRTTVSLPRAETHATSEDDKPAGKPQASDILDRIRKKTQAAKAES
jgi:hypothetical protein